MAPVVASSTTGFSEGSELALPKPTGVSVGDVLVVFAYDQLNRPFGEISGWTSYPSTIGTDTSFSAYVRIADGTEPASQVVTQSNPFRVLGAYLRITGADASGLAFQPDGSDGNESQVYFAPITSPADDSLDLLIFGVKNGIGSPPAGYAVDASLDAIGNGVAAFSATVPSGALAEESYSVGAFRTWSSGRFVIAPSDGGGGGTDVELTLGTGSSAVEGYSPTVSTTTVVDVDLTPGSGSAEVSGSAPTVSAGSQVSPGAGVADVAGSAPGVSSDAASVPGTGAATVEGFAPTVTTSDVIDVTVTPGTGAASVSGSAPSVSAGAAVAPGTGSAIVAGFAPTVITDGSVNVTPGTGIVTVEGSAPTVSASVTVSLGSDSATVAGYAPTVEAGGNVIVTPGVGAASVSGFAPSVSADAIVTPGTGAATVTGFAPAISPIIVDIGALNRVVWQPDLTAFATWRDTPRKTVEWADIEATAIWRL